MEIVESEREDNSMSLVEYAKRELAMIEHDEDGMQDLMDQNIIEILERAEAQGHSGFSAGYLISCLERLMRFLPLKPLTGEDDEWNEIGRGEYQNKRCSRVFKKNGEAYDIEGKVFSRDGGRTWFMNSESHVRVTFPYAPPSKPERVILDEEEEE